MSAELGELTAERAGRVLTVRVKVRSERHLDVDARVDVLSYGPGWSGYACELREELSLVPGQERVIEVSCERDWRAVEEPGHTRVRLSLGERTRWRGRPHRVHLAIRSVRVPRLCPAPRTP